MSIDAMKMALEALRTSDCPDDHPIFGTLRRAIVRAAAEIGRNMK